MKGTIFCEFLNMTEENFGYQTVDQIITESSLPNDGAYTSVGTYSFDELVTLLGKLSNHTQISINQLLNNFGVYLFKCFLKKYPTMFEQVSDGFTFLELVPQKIHIEVKKLYPDAELPTIDINVKGSVLTMKYSSSRKLGDLAKGLISGCMEYFDEKISLSEHLVKQDGSEIVFTIKRL